MVAFVLLGCALVLIAGVEWPRVSAKVGSDARAGRKRARRKEALTVIEGDADGKTIFRRASSATWRTCPCSKRPTTTARIASSR